MKLIPNDITVFEQIQRKNEFLRLVANWAGALQLGKIHRDELLKVSGVSCEQLNCKLVNFEIVDEKVYTMFILRYA